MRRSLLLGIAVLQLLGAGALASDPSHLQPVQAVPQGEQRVEWITPAGTQAVEAAPLEGEQRVDKPEIPTDAQRTATKVGKVTLGVVGGALGLASMAAMLIFI